MYITNCAQPTFDPASSLSIISNAQNAALYVPSPSTFFFSTDNTLAKVFTIELANLVKSEVGCPDIELDSILNSAYDSPIDSTVFTVDLVAATMTALTGNYTKAGDYYMNVVVKYTGAAYTNTFEFALTGQIQDSCHHELHWQNSRSMFDDDAEAERTHDLAVPKTEISVNVGIIEHVPSKPYSCSDAIETDFEIGTLVKDIDFSYSSVDGKITIN